MANPLGNMGRNILNQMQESLYMKPTPNRQIKNLQLEELRREKLEQENLRTAMSTYGAGLPPTAQAGFNALPLSIQQQIVAAPMTRTPQALPSNVMLYNHFKTDPTPEDNVITLEDQAQMDANMTAYGDFVQAVSPKGVTIDQRQQNFKEKQKMAFFEMGTSTIKDFKTLINQNKPVMNRAKVMRNMLNNPDFETGKMQEAMLPMKQWAYNLGFLYDESVPQQEFFQAMAKFIVPRMRAEGSGSTSDKEMVAFEQATATLAGTAAGNRLILDVFINGDTSNKTILSEQEKYLRENDSLIGFDDYMSEMIIDEKTGLEKSRQEHIAPLFRSYNFEPYSDGKTDFDLEKEAGYLKKGDLYFDQRTSTFKNLGFENDATTISSGGIK
tara:strand:- start:9879 stop:11030 length:1152 start_codon:yes stop_codon:yes gene_type:complete